MPIYEYVCQACGEPAEILQKISDPPETECPACGRAALQKQVSAAGFRLNGGGWYETDFKSGDKKNLAGDKVVAKTDSAAKSDAGTSTPAAASDKPAAAAKPATPAASS